MEKFTIEQNKELCNRMPYLIPRNVFTDEIDPDYDYSWTILDEADEGWRDLFLQLNEDILPYLIKYNCVNKFRWSQIKEKYGVLCAYNFGAPKEVHDIIMKYEFLSNYVCSNCGRPVVNGTKYGYGWIYNSCLDCHMFMATKFHNFNSEQSINNWFNGLCIDMFDGKMKIERVKDGTTITETIDCTNEWNRYCATHEPKTYRNVF